MKKLILVLCGGLLLTSVTYSQSTVTDVIDGLRDLPDQFDNAYDVSGLRDQLTLIYIPGINNPFEKIYFKQKASKTKSNVLLVGGFKEMMNMTSAEAKKEHLQEALSIQYKEGSTILIDLESELQKLLAVQGYAIVTLSIAEDKIISRDDYGFDRVAFFQALKNYETD